MAALAVGGVFDHREIQHIFCTLLKTFEFRGTHADCVFTDWAGFLSPLTVKFKSVGTVRNSTFRNMNLEVEIADVSFEGIVHFEEARLANVTLSKGNIVSTSLNDYQQAIGFYLSYYADDDAEYDVLVSAVPRGETGVFGEEWVIRNDTASDCIYLLSDPGVLLPGCSQSTLAARNRTIDRGLDTGSRKSNGVPFSQVGAASPAPAGVLPCCLCGLACLHLTLYWHAVCTWLFVDAS